MRRLIGRLIACLRRGHWPQLHRGRHVTLCLRCEPCLVCRSDALSCIGRCAAERLS
ncbi:hypothetical protein OIE13_06110 [Streptosporangium sp. NBC_01810]|uniref:hypothetical protein n=1 Tax=Streptosporangium sp. NBC_01810 TaxID=2975951 RepID=UPI002DD81313|nr:hypothetical protein [Streptosporangium sp. NBC_01810]WSA27448.1 hypothetical protein OIE13_06110 [Streptosporangium sp. NBC_01810]